VLSLPPVLAINQTPITKRYIYRAFTSSATSPTTSNYYYQRQLYYYFATPTLLLLPTPVLPGLLTFNSQSTPPHVTSSQKSGHFKIGGENHRKSHLKWGPKRLLNRRKVAKTKAFRRVGPKSIGAGMPGNETRKTLIYRQLKIQNKATYRG
jgi:hypothetical protein